MSIQLCAEAVLSASVRTDPWNLAVPCGILLNLIIKCLMAKLTIQHLKCYFEAKWLLLNKKWSNIEADTFKQVPLPPRYNKIWPYQMSHPNANGVFKKYRKDTAYNCVRDDVTFKWGGIIQTIFGLLRRCEWITQPSSRRLWQFLLIIQWQTIFVGD